MIENRQHDTAKVTRRVVGLVLLNLLIVLALAQVEWNVLHAGTFGITVGVDGAVHAVAPGGSAARAGIVAGDRLRLREVSRTDRLALLYTLAGDRVTVPVRAGGASRTLALVAAPTPPQDAWSLARAYGYPLLVLISLALATLVVMLRPGVPAWTYYAFVWLSTICAFQTELFVKGPVWYQLAVLMVFQIAFLGALVTLMLFSTRLFEPERAWQARWERTILGIVAIDFVIWFYFLYAYVYGWWSGKLLIPLLGHIGDVAVAAAVLLVLSTIVRRSRQERRQRVVWAFVGLALQPALVIANAAQGLLLEAFSSWSNAFALTPFYQLLEPWAALIGALAVSYAFINEHILDIRFAIGRATGYAITSVLLILFMTICEWSLGELFADSHVAAYVTLAAAVLAAFSFNGLHERIDALLDVAFFRREYFAEQRLRRSTRALAFVTSEATAISFLIDEPIEALELAAAALYRLDERSKSYVRCAERGWPSDALPALGIDDPLIAKLRSERTPLSVRQLGWDPPGLPDGVARPVIAVPALARSDLYAFALYGAHRDGATLNPEERTLLGDLVANAAATFDHIDAQQAREEIDDLKRRLALLVK